MKPDIHPEYRETTVTCTCGNTFVMKPSEKDPTLSLELAKLLTEAGLPKGVFNIVHGDKTAVDALLTHDDIGFGNRERDVQSRAAEHCDRSG